MKILATILLFSFLSLIISCEKKLENNLPNSNIKEISYSISKIRKLSQDLRQWIDLIDKQAKTNTKEALILCDKLIQTALATKNREGEALGNYQKAFIYDQYLGQYGDALPYYFNAFTIYKELDIQLGINECLMGMGGVYYKLKFLDKALSYYQQALTSIQQINNKQKEAQIHYAIANCHMGLHKNLPIIINDYIKSLTILQELKDEVGIGNCYNLMASAYYFLGTDYLQAKKYYLQAVIIFQAENKMEELGNVYYNLGLLHNEMKESAIAKNYFKQAIEIGKQYGYSDLVVSGEFQLGKMQANLKNYPQAINHGLAALSVIHNDERTKAELTYFLSQSYEAIGNKDQALAYSNQTINLKTKNEKNNLTSLSKENQQRASVYDFEIKISEITSSNENKWIMISIGIIFIFLAGYILSTLYHRNQNKGLQAAFRVSQERNKEFKSTLLDAQNKMLYFLKEIADLKNRLGM